MGTTTPVLEKLVPLSSCKLVKYEIVMCLVKVCLLQFLNHLRQIISKTIL